MSAMTLEEKKDFCKDAIRYYLPSTRITDLSFSDGKPLASAPIPLELEDFMDDLQLEDHEEASRFCSFADTHSVAIQNNRIVCKDAEFPEYLADFILEANEMIESSVKLAWDACEIYIAQAEKEDPYDIEWKGEKSELEKWSLEIADRHPAGQGVIDDTMDAMYHQVELLLPHGSGINDKWEFSIHQNGTDNTAHIFMQNRYEHMNENGFYDASIPFTVDVSLGLDGRLPSDVSSCYEIRLQPENGYAAVCCQDEDLKAFLDAEIFSAIKEWRLAVSNEPVHYAFHRACLENAVYNDIPLSLAMKSQQEGWGLSYRDAMRIEADMRKEPSLNQRIKQVELKELYGEVHTTVVDHNRISRETRPEVYLKDAWALHAVTAIVSDEQGHSFTMRFPFAEQDRAVLLQPTIDESSVLNGAALSNEQKAYMADIGSKELLGYAKDNYFLVQDDERTVQDEITPNLRRMEYLYAVESLSANGGKWKETDKAIQQVPYFEKDAQDRRECILEALQSYKVMSSIGINTAAKKQKELEKIVNKESRGGR